MNSNEVFVFANIKHRFKSDINKEIFDNDNLLYCRYCFEVNEPDTVKYRNGCILCFKCEQILKVILKSKSVSKDLKSMTKKLSGHVRYPCKFSSNGCSMSLLSSEKSNHERYCILRPQRKRSLISRIWTFWKIGNAKSNQQNETSAHQKIIFAIRKTKKTIVNKC